MFVCLPATSGPFTSHTLPSSLLAAGSEVKPFLSLIYFCCALETWYRSSVEMPSPPSTENSSRIPSPPALFPRDTSSGPGRQGRGERRSMTLVKERVNTSVPSAPPQTRVKIYGGKKSRKKKAELNLSWHSEKVGSTLSASGKQTKRLMIRESDG